MQQMEKLYIVYGVFISHLSPNPKATFNRSLQARTTLTDDEGILGGEVVGRDLEVERCRTLPDTARDVVVGTVAGAEPATIVTGLADGHATKVSADTYQS